MTALTLSTRAIRNPNHYADKSSWRGILDNRNQQDIFFPVSLENLDDHLGTNLTTNGEQVVIDQSQQRIIAVHGNQYSLTTNAEAFDAVNEALNVVMAKGILNTEGMYIRDDLVKRGGKVIRQYIFPNEAVAIGNGDVTMLRLVVINSYDGSCNLSILAGGFRIVCVNGQVVGERFLSLNKKHTSELDLVAVQRRIAHSVKSFQDMGNYWKVLINTSVSEAAVNDSLTQLCVTPSGVNLNKFLALTDLYKEHKKDLGANYWALYNTMTAYSTHYEVQERSIPNLAQIQLERQSEVVKVMHSKAWDLVNA